MKALDEQLASIAAKIANQTFVAKMS